MYKRPNSERQPDNEHLGKRFDVDADALQRTDLNKMQLALPNNEVYEPTPEQKALGDTWVNQQLEQPETIETPGYRVPRNGAEIQDDIATMLKQQLEAIEAKMQKDHTKAVKGGVKIDLGKYKQENGYEEADMLCSYMQQLLRDASAPLKSAEPYFKLDSFLHKSYLAALMVVLESLARLKLSTETKQTNLPEKEITKFLGEAITALVQHPRLAPQITSHLQFLDDGLSLIFKKAKGAQKKLAVGVVQQAVGLNQIARFLDQIMPEFFINPQDLVKILNNAIRDWPLYEARKQQADHVEEITRLISGHGTSRIDPKYLLSIEDFIGQMENKVGGRLRFLEDQSGPSIEQLFLAEVRRTFDQMWSNGSPEIDKLKGIIKRNRLQPPIQVKEELLPEEITKISVLKWILDQKKPNNNYPQIIDSFVLNSTDKQFTPEIWLYLAALKQALHKKTSAVENGKNIDIHNDIYIDVTKYVFDQRPLTSKSAKALATYFLHSSTSQIAEQTINQAVNDVATFFTHAIAHLQQHFHGVDGHWQLKPITLNCQQISREIEGGMTVVLIRVQAMHGTRPLGEWTIEGGDKMENLTSRINVQEGDLQFNDEVRLGKFIKGRPATAAN